MVEVKLKGMNPELRPVLEFDIPLTVACPPQAGVLTFVIVFKSG